VFGGRGVNGAELVVKAADGTVLKDYGVTSTDGRSMADGRNNRTEKLWTIVEVIRGEADEIACTAEDALLHARVMETVNQRESIPFPAERVTLDDEMYFVPGLAETLWECFEERKLPKF